MQDDGSYLFPRLSRRDFLGGAAGLAAGALLPVSVRAQSSDSIHELRGDVRVNGKRIDERAVIRPGDVVLTTASGYVVFAIGKDAFMLRERSELRLEPAPEQPLLVQGLRLLTGALGAVFGKRARTGALIHAPTVTAGIRGTGCYLETRGDGTYFCTCYGTIELASKANPRDRETSTTKRHDNPRLVLAQPRDGQLFLPAAFETHTDEEMDMLEKCVGRRAPWIQTR
ncbi:MAG: twin-arginine translocation signal domain-containing protein [Burkholderiales bacterium]